MAARSSWRASSGRGWTGTGTSARPASGEWTAPARSRLDGLRAAHAAEPVPDLWPAQSWRLQLTGYGNNHAYLPGGLTLTEVGQIVTVPYTLAALGVRRPRPPSWASHPCADGCGGGRPGRDAAVPTGQRRRSAPVPARDLRVTLTIRGGSDKTALRRATTARQTAAVPHAIDLANRRRHMGQDRTAVWGTRGSTAARSAAVVQPEPSGGRPAGMRQMHPMQRSAIGRAALVLMVAFSPWTAGGGPRRGRPAQAGGRRPGDRHLRHEQAGVGDPAAGHATGGRHRAGPTCRRPT